MYKRICLSQHLGFRRFVVFVLLLLACLAEVAIALVGVAHVDAAGQSPAVVVVAELMPVVAELLPVVDAAGHSPPAVAQAAAILHLIGVDAASQCPAVVA